MGKRPKQATVDIGLRVKEPLRAQIDRAAKQRGVSMNHEIVERLQRSFENERYTVEEVFGGREIYGIMRVIAAAVHETGHAAGYYSTGSRDGAAGWLRQPWAYDQAVQAAQRVFEALRPAGEISPPERAEHMQNLGRGFASGVLNEIARGQARTDSTAQRTEELRRDLGPIAEQLTEAETGKEDLMFNVQRDDQQQVIVTLTNKKPTGEKK